MNLVKIFMVSLAIMLLMSGCQGTNSDANTTVVVSDTNNIVTSETNTSVVSDANTTIVELNKLVINPNNVTIASSNYTKGIVLDAYTNQNTRDVTTTLLVKYPTEIINNNIDVGSLPSRINVVDGKADFQYTGPIDLADTLNKLETAGLSNLVSLNLYDEVTGVNVNLDLNFTQNSIQYNLISIPTSLKITEPNQTITIDIYLEDDSTTVKKPVANEEIIVDYFNGTQGAMDSFSAVTDANGHTVFNYTSPATLKANGQDYNLTFRMKNNTTVSQTSSLTVDTTPPQAKIRLENSSIDITVNAQTVQVKVLAFDENNQSLQTGSVFVRYPSEIVDQNVSGGKFNENEVAITNGEAVFTFVGPDPLKSMNSLNFTFVYKENTNVTTNLTVNYKPAVPTVILTDDNVTVTTNSQIVNIDVRVISEDNTPYPDGNVKIFYPDDVRSGRDIGGFLNSTVPVSNGLASFVYIAPSKLDENTSDIVFKFYHEANPVEAKTFTVKIVPDVNQIVLNSYLLKSTLSDENATIGLNSSKLMSFFIADDSDTIIPDSNVSSITVEMLNPMLGQLESTDGSSGTSLTIVNKNNVTVNLRTNTVSGILPFKVTAVFSDSNNEQQTLTKIFNIVVLSGPPSAISFSYAGTDSQSKQNDAKMIEHWVITVTDRYNNLVNTNPAVSMGAIVGYVQSSPTTASNVGNYLYYEPNEVNGTLSSANNNFTTTANVFDNVDQTNDYLVTFGNGYTYNASGKWDINTNNSNTLDLRDTYEGNDTSNLGFAVGHNYRQDACEFGAEWVANVYPEETGNYVIDSTGSMRINVEYDYYLVGKDVVLWANLVGKQYDNNTTVRIGEGRKILLKGAGINGASFTYPQGFQGLVHLPVMINETTEYYKNANFSATVVVTGVDENWTVVGTSMDDGSNGQNVNIRPYTDATMYSCVGYNGVAYVDINFTKPSPEGGTVSLENVLPINEF